MRSVNPATGETIAEHAAHTPAEAAALLEAAGVAWRSWRAASYADRASVLRAAARGLRARATELARLAVLEMGKPIAQAEAEVEKCAATCDWYAEHGERLLAPEDVPSDATRSGTRCEPLGVLLAVMPWNFPYWQVVRAAAPALMAGNAVALKHASNVTGVALEIERTWTDAGAPPGVFRTLVLPSRDVAAAIDHPTVACVTLTGGEPAGVEVAGRAGRSLKKVVLELGGSDPFIVLADADLERAAQQAALARVQNNGQSCIAAKRFIVVGDAARRFAELLASRMAALVVGDPRERSHLRGTIARRDLVDELHAQVERSVAAGARVLTGGTRPAGPGAFYPPTVLADVVPGMAAFDEETFGPLAPVTRARDEAEAVALANRSRYGLGASIWTRDAARGEALAGAIEAGAVFVNGIVKSDPRLPFGGIKRSGHGRELGAAGIREFVNLKTVWVRED